MSARKGQQRHGTHRIAAFEEDDFESPVHDLWRRALPDPPVQARPRDRVCDREGTKFRKANRSSQQGVSDRVGEASGREKFRARRLESAPGSTSPKNKNSRGEAEDEDGDGIAAAAAAVGGGASTRTKTAVEWYTSRSLAGIVVVVGSLASMSAPEEADAAGFGPCATGQAVKLSSLSPPTDEDTSVEIGTGVGCCAEGWPGWNLTGGWGGSVERVERGRWWRTGSDWESESRDAHEGQ